MIFGMEVPKSKSCVELLHSLLWSALWLIVNCVNWKGSLFFFANVLLIFFFLFFFSFYFLFFSCFVHYHTGTERSETGTSAKLLHCPTSSWVVEILKK